MCMDFLYLTQAVNKQKKNQFGYIIPLVYIKKRY